jgi:hypothetical protein
MIRSIFVVQYGGWWKLTPDEWTQICRDGMTGDGYMLPRHRTITRRSPLVGATDYNDGEGRTSYYPLRDDVLVYTPLDWEPEEFGEALKELDKKMAKSTPESRT